MMEKEQKQKICQLLVRKIRQEKEWSLESLAHGICSVSYLSKLEKGDALCSEEILSLLMKRLKISQPFGNEADQKSAEYLLGLLQEGRFEQALAFMNEETRFSENWLQSVEGKLYLNFFGTYYPETEHQTEKLPELEGHIELFDPPLQALWFLCRHQWKQAQLSCPQGWVFFASASMMYSVREKEFEILPLLQKAYSLASDEGNIPLMAVCSLVQATVCSNMSDQKEALRLHQRTLRILKSWPDSGMLDDVRYNMAACLLEQGEFRKALEALEQISRPKVMAYHKMAVCYEQLSQNEKALAALEKAADPYMDREGWDESLLEQVLGLIRFRINDPDHLHNPEYGACLMAVFEKLTELDCHIGFLRFHLPWVIQWLKANRQYQKIVFILETFPCRPAFEPS